MLYADTSALVKLVLAEAESAALRQHIAGQELVCSALAITELERAVTRAGPGYGAQVQDVLDGIYLVSLDDEHLRRAGRLGPPELRTLDAIHIATALGLGARVEALVTYDERMRSALAQHSVRVDSPR